MRWLGGAVLSFFLLGKLYAQQPTNSKQIPVATDSTDNRIYRPYSNPKDTLRISANPDSVAPAPKREPKAWPVPGRAARFSLLLPGLGQVYNQDYWKLPIIYGYGVFLYGLFTQYNREYNLYRSAFTTRESYLAAMVANGGTAPKGTPTDPFISTISDPNSLKSYRDYYRKTRDEMVFFILVGYAANAIEAYVDAHLKHFDVSDRLSLSLKPQVRMLASGTVALGPALTLHIH